MNLNGLADLNLVSEIRQKIPIQKHRRPDLFSKF
jgi:hypothetical protein